MQSSATSPKLVSPASSRPSIEACVRACVIVYGITGYGFECVRVPAGGLEASEASEGVLAVSEVCVATAGSAADEGARVATAERGVDCTHQTHAVSERVA